MERDVRKSGGCSVVEMKSKCENTGQSCKGGTSMTKQEATLSHEEECRAMNITCRTPFLCSSCVKIFCIQVLSLDE